MHGKYSYLMVGLVAAGGVLFLTGNAGGLLVSSVLAVPMALVIGVAAASPNGTCASHVSSCAQTSPGFTGQHNPRHHRGGPPPTP